MQVLSATDSLVWLFVFILKSLLSLLFTSCYTMEAFLIFLYYYYLIPQCLLNILLCISRYNTACDVSYASSYSFLLINVMLVCHCNTVLLLLCFLIKNTNESIFCFSLKKWKVYRYKQNRPLSFLVKLTPRSFKWKQKEEFLSQNINHK